MEDLRISVTSEAAHLLAKVEHILAKENIEAYLVGGFVRDILLGRDSGDIDIAVAANALEVAAKVARVLDGKYVTLDEDNEVGRVILSGKDAGFRRELDFSTLKDTIENDLAQRDFTIDAMAIELKEFVSTLMVSTPTTNTDNITLHGLRLIDPFNGHDDLHQETIRAVSEACFSSDPARLLRAVRLASELNFHVDQGTEINIRRHCHLITEAAGERVREELLRILSLSKSAQFLDYLDRLGILTEIIPELSSAKGVDQPLIHYWDVFNHSLQTVAALEFLLRESDWQYVDTATLSAVPWSAELSQRFDQEVSSGSTRKSLLKLAVLLHDIAKPATKTVDEDGRARFLGHTNDGAAMTANILERLRFSTREIRMVEIMVKNHLRPGQMSNYGLPSHRAIYRYFRDTGDTGTEILFLSLADHLATRGPCLELIEWQRHAQMVEYVLTRHMEEIHLLKPPKLIDGHDLVNIFGLKPGPKIGELLETVREAQACGEVNSRKQALDYINHLLL